MTFNTVLIANRGEIAVRVIRTVHAMGLQAVAIYSDADAAAPHVLAADKAVHIRPAAASESYLNIDKVIAAAHSAGAQAIHPGYGFLSENAEFAARCEKEGITFIEPPASAMEKMGDKITAAPPWNPAMYRPCRESHAPGSVMTTSSQQPRTLGSRFSSSLPPVVVERVCTG